MKIELPNYHWFVCQHEGRYVANVYTGSLGTQSDVGCIGVCTFHYRGYVDTASGKESEFRVIAECYLIQPWHLGGKKTDWERAELGYAEEGMAQAEKWLSDMSSRYGF